MSKRTLESFFESSVKKPKQTVESFERQVSPPQSRAKDSKEQELSQNVSTQATAHRTYPWAIVDLPPNISNTLGELLGVSEGKVITNQPNLDLLYFRPLIPQSTANDLFLFLRASLPFYRVKYSINRFGKSLDINTPRYTTVFGLDETSQFHTTQVGGPSQSTTQLSTRIVESSNLTREVSASKYKCEPRPIPSCLAILKNLTEVLTQDTYNFVLVNYYATGNDSITYHSDDERFLGINPSIASYTLGASRDFLMKHKPPANGQPAIEAEPLKFKLGSGDMILMRGETQAHWLHSIPKRKNPEVAKGRINITMRKAMIPAGTENYYRYNVGDGPVYKWDEKRKEMVLWKKG